MNKTFALIVQFTKIELSIEKKKPVLTPKIKNFIEQLIQDFSEFVVQNEQDINKHTKKLQKILSDLKDNAPLLKRISLEKINALYTLLESYESDDALEVQKTHQASALLVKLYMNLENEIQKRTTINIQNHVCDYHTLLLKKLAKEQIQFNSNDSIKNLPASISSKQQKLITRYEVIAELHQQIQGKSRLDEHDITNVREAVNICKRNQPDWMERSLLQKITDILTLGIKPLYRMFFAPEVRLSDEIEKNMPSAKL